MTGYSMAFVGAASPPAWAEVFWSYVDRDGPTVMPEIGNCWLWTGSRSSKGYGLFKIPISTVGSRLESAHRVAYVLAKGPIPGGHMIRHRCDNTACVRPEHLLTGTMRDNAADAISRGRNSRGEKHGESKLTEDAVREIRALRACGVATALLAERFGVNRRQVEKIVLRQQWAHVS